MDFFKAHNCGIVYPGWPQMSTVIHCTSLPSEILISGGKSVRNMDLSN